MSQSASDLTPTTGSSAKGPSLAATLPTQARTLLDDIRDELPLLLGRNFVGIYIHGSLTQRAFRSCSSDLDLLVLTRRPLTERQFARTASWLEQCRQVNPWAARLELIFLLRDKAISAGAPACSFYGEALTRCRSDGNPLVWLNILQRGITLAGEAPVQFIPRISREALLAGLRTELEYLREEICDGLSGRRGTYSYRAYSMLTLCRILFTMHRGTIASKPQAVRWAEHRLPAQWGALARQALEGVEPETSRKLPLLQLAELIRYTQAELRARIQA